MIPEQIKIHVLNLERKVTVFILSVNSYISLFTGGVFEVPSLYCITINSLFPQKKKLQF